MFKRILQVTKIIFSFENKKKLGCESFEVYLVLK